MGRRDSALADSVFSTIGVLAQGLSRFAYTAIVGRLLGASDLAAVNAGFAVAILLSLAWPTAAGNAAGAFAPRDDPAAARALLRSVSLSLPPIALLAVVAAALLGGHSAAIVQAPLLTIAWSGYIFGRGLFIGAGHVRSAAVWDVVTGALAIILLVVFVSAHWTSWLLVPATVAYAIFGAAAVCSRPWRAPSVSPRRFAGFIVWNSLALIATNGLMQVSMLFAAGMDTAANAGQFAAALALATPVSMVAQAVTQAMLPRFGRWAPWDEASRLRQVRRATGALAIVMAGGCALVVIALPWVLPLFYGDAFTPAVPLAQGLMAAVFGFSLSVFLAAYLATVGRAKAATVCTAIGSSVGVAVMAAAGTAVGGAEGAVLGAVVGMTVSLILLIGVALGPSFTRSARSPEAGSTAR